MQQVLSQMQCDLLHPWEPACFPLLCRCLKAHNKQGFPLQREVVKLIKERPENVAKTLSMVPEGCTLTPLPCALA